MLYLLLGSCFFVFNLFVFPHNWFLTNFLWMLCWFWIYQKYQSIQDCRVVNKLKSCLLSSSGNSQSYCKLIPFTQYIFCWYSLFFVQLQDTDTTSGESEVKFQVSRDTLGAMLRSMAYIREQLSNAVRILNLNYNICFYWLWKLNEYFLNLINEIGRYLFYMLLSYVLSQSIVT